MNNKSKQKILTLIKESKVDLDKKKQLLKELKEGNLKKFVQEVPWRRKTVSSMAVHPKTVAAVAGSANLLIAGFMMTFGGRAIPWLTWAAKRTLKATVISALLFGSYRIIRNLFDEKCTSKCGLFKMNDIKRQYCIYKCKLARIQKEIHVTKLAMKDVEKLPKDKSYTKLKIKLAKKIRELEQQELETTNSLKEYEKLSHNPKYFKTHKSAY